MTYKQYDFMREHGINPKRMRSLRESTLTKKEWWKDGVTVYWNEAANAKMLNAIGIAPECPQIDQNVPDEQVLKTEPATDCGASSCDSGGSGGEIKATVVCVAKNTRYVYVDVDGKRVSVKADRHPERMIGKTILLRKDGQEYQRVQ